MIKLVDKESTGLINTASDFIGHSPSSHFTLYIISNHKEFYKIAGEHVPDWATGIYSPGRKAIVINTESMTSDPDNFIRILQHEVVHACLDDMFGKHRSNLPVWLNEGIAVLVSDAWEVPESFIQRKSIVYKALKDGNDIDFKDISDSFPSGNWMAQLAYIQSYDFVNFLYRSGGKNKLQYLLKHLSSGADIDSSFQKVYHTSFSEFVSRWKKYNDRPGFFIWFMQFLIYFDTYIWTFMALLVIIGAFRVFFRIRKGRKYINHLDYDPEDDWDNLDEEWDADLLGQRPWRPGKRYDNH